MSKKKKGCSTVRKPVSLLILFAGEIVLIGVGLLAYAYFHHVQPQHIEALNIVSNRPGNRAAQMAGNVESAFASETGVASEGKAVSMANVSAAPSPEPLPTMVSEPSPTFEPAEQALDATLPPTPTPEPTATPDPVGYFGSKFKDKFTTGEVLITDSSYQSENVCVQLQTQRTAGTLIHVADIYIRDISCFKAGLAFGRVDKNIREAAKDIARRSNAIVSLTGDFYSMRPSSIVLRNGILYRDTMDPDQDVCVLYWDGTVETYPAKGFDVYQEMDRGAYQIWSFGPMLLDQNGNALTRFNHDLKTVSNGLVRKRARTALGYYEPGHYCFVAVDYGTADTHGLSAASLSSLMNYLGCKRAYNLDGGQSAQMYVGTKVYNHPENGGRKISDMLVITEPTAEELERLK